MNANALPALCGMLRSPFADSAELAALALGNVASESVAMRDAVLRAGAAEGLAAALAEHTGEDVPPSFAEHATWALATVFKGTPAPPADVLRPAVAPLAARVNDEHDDTARNALWALCFYTDGGERVADVLAQPGVLASVVEVLTRHSPALDAPAARLLANIACGDEDAATALVDAGVLHHAAALLGSTDVAVRREACWMLANVAAGTAQHAQAVADEPDLVQRLVAVALCADEQECVRAEAHFALANLVLCSSDELLRQLAQRRRFVAALCRNHDAAPDTDAALVAALKRMQSVLDRPGSFEAERHTFVALLVESGADDVLRKISKPELQDDIRTILSSLGDEQQQQKTATSTTTTEQEKSTNNSSTFDDIE